MNLKDVWATDENGHQFVFTVEMQRKLIEQGLEPTPEALSQLDDSIVTRPQPAQNDLGASKHQSKQEHTKSDSDFEVPMTIQIDPETGKYLGRMKWYNAKKGYGFIMRGGGEEIFFHKSAIEGDPETLSEGQWILYDIEETNKGPEAAEIEPYSGDVDLLG